MQNRVSGVWRFGGEGEIPIIPPVKYSTSIIGVHFMHQPTIVVYNTELTIAYTLTP